LGKIANVNNELVILTHALIANNICANLCCILIDASHLAQPLLKRLNRQAIALQESNALNRCAKAGSRCNNWN
jgi:hypothetical protein